MPGAQCLDPPDRRQHGVAGILIDKARVGVRALGEHAAVVRGSVQDGDATRPGEIDHVRGVSIHQGEAVVRDHGVEVPVAQDRHHGLDLARSKPDGLSKPLLLHGEEFAERAARAGDVRQARRMFGVVQMKQMDAFKAQSLQALFQGAAGPRPVEAPGIHVPVQLGGDDEPVG